MLCVYPSCYSFVYIMYIIYLIIDLQFLVVSEPLCLSAWGVSLALFLTSEILSDIYADVKVISHSWLLFILTRTSMVSVLSVCFLSHLMPYSLAKRAKRIIGYSKQQLCQYSSMFVSGLPCIRTTYIHVAYPYNDPWTHGILKIRTFTQGEPCYSAHPCCVVRHYTVGRKNLIVPDNGNF